MGVKAPIDMDAFERSESEGAGPKMHVVDIFFLGRCLTEDEVAALHNTVGGLNEFRAVDFTDTWQWTNFPSRVSALTSIAVKNMGSQFH